MLLQPARAAQRGERAGSQACWEIGRHRIVLGDCLAELKRLGAESVDVCVTSPPYNIGVAYQSHDDRMPKAAYLAWMRDVAQEIARVLRPDGSFFLNVGGTNIDPWIAMEVAREFNQHFRLQNNIIWVKSVTVGGETFGHFKPITSTRFLNNNFESIFHFTKTGKTQIDRLAIGVPFKDKSNIARWGHAEDRRCDGNVWFIPYKTVRSKAQKYDHPAGFPVDLPLKCILLHGREGAVVLDPFLGAGTTLVAAERAGASGIGIEIDRVYAETAAARLTADQPQQCSSYGKG
jgi:site-specific DNA-methyltransferase (adenine-specific)